MNKEMVISSTPHETRVAILEDDQAVEIFIEREHSRGVVGNIYKGRVSKVLPGMQSAFVDLGLERDAFLYVTDVISPTEEALEDDEELVPAPVPEATPSGDPLPDEAVNGVAGQDSAPELEAAEGPEAPEPLRTTTRHRPLLNRPHPTEHLSPRPPEHRATGSRIGAGPSGRRPRRGLRTWSKRSRRSWCRWSKSRLAPRAPASPAT